MSIRLLFSITILVCVLASANGQSNPSDNTPIEELKPAEYFDFWLGEWDLTFNDPKDESTARAVNTIERVLSDKVIKENFEVISGSQKGYIGKSWSVYNPRNKTWKQTWVDNQGSYLDFDGKIEGEKRIFWRKASNSDGKEIIQRMVFYDIEENSFTWDWESSEDGGKTWKLLWRIHYKRKR